MESSGPGHSGHADHRAHALHLPQVVWFVWVVREESLLEYYMPKLIEANQEPGFNIRIYQTGKPKEKAATPAADGGAKAESAPAPEPEPEPPGPSDDVEGRRQYRVSNLPSGVRTLGYRNSADIDDRCGNDIFAAAGSTHAAMDETEDMAQVAEGRWLPKTFLLDVTDLEMPSSARGRPRMAGIVSAVDKEASAKCISDCAVLACGPDALLAGVKEAIADVGTETSFQFHEETFDF